MKWSETKLPIWHRAIIFGLLVFCCMNYLVRLVPYSFGEYTALRVHDVANRAVVNAWFEFAVVLAIQVALSLCLHVFVGIRELGRIALLGRQAGRISVRTYLAMSFGVAMAIAATSDLLKPWYPPDTRIGALPFHLKAPMAGFWDMMMLVGTFISLLRPSLIGNEFDRAKDGQLF